MSRKKLSKREKQRRRAERRRIKKEYEKTGGIQQDGTQITLQEFTRRAKMRAKTEGISIVEASKKEANSMEFVGAAQRSRQNLLNSIREKYPDVYHKLVELNKAEFRDEKGRYMSLMDNLEWDQDLGAYTLGGIYLIETTNSPTSVHITSLLTGDDII